MAIPESQLQTWSHQGAVTTSSTTYHSVQNALAAATSPIRNAAYEVYLQGSYKNDTNIRGDSDVDVVVQLNATFGYDVSKLDHEQKAAFETAYPENATYQWTHFRSDTVRALRSYYGNSAVTEGNKSLKLVPASGRLAADVIPAIHFRRYSSFYAAYSEHHVEGIKFWSQNDGRSIINFPKLHYDNGVAKQSRTNGRYKQTVRMFKNARTYLIDHGTISGDLAPSYFLESLLFNVPDAKFGLTLEDTFVGTFSWIWLEAPPDSFVCQNGQLPLFGPAPEQWKALKANQFLTAIKQLWENW